MVTPPSQPEPQPNQWRALERRDAMVLLLAAAGAAIDVVSYLEFGHVFTANQTGNTILFAVALAQGQPATAFRAVTSLVGFVVGAALGEWVVVDDRETAVWPSAVGRALGLELIVLAAILLVWHRAGLTPSDAEFGRLVGLASIAMGIQSSAVARLGLTGITTTFISGTLTTSAIEAVRAARGTYRRAGSPARGDTLPLAALAGRGPWLPTLSWLAYLVGAALTGLLNSPLGEATLVLPIAAIVAVIAVESGRRSPEG